VKISKEIINATAGDTVMTEWHHTLDGAKPGDKSDPIDPGHLGPTIAYLARVDNALTQKVTGLKCPFDRP
jgi:cellulase